LVATATSIAGFLLGVAWLLGGNLMHERWNMEPSASSLLDGGGAYERDAPVQGAVAGISGVSIFEIAASMSF